MNASCSESDNGAGLGFILLDGDTYVITGTRKRGQAKSPIHAEVESLLWAMGEVSGRDFQQVSFESEKLFFLGIHSKSYPYKNCSSSVYIPCRSARYMERAELMSSW